MTKALKDFRPVYVVGIGLHPYQFMGPTPYVELGLTAVRGALTDAGISWPDVESVYTGTALIGMATSRIMLRHLGASGVPMTQVENASASGSSAVRQAVLDVASGMTDISLGMGVDKPAIPQFAPSKTGIKNLDDGLVEPVSHFALLAERYMNDFGATIEDFARVVVKNSANGALNENAQKRKARSIEDILTEEPLSGAITPRQCCPIGEGAAAVIVASEDAIERLGIDRSRAIRVASSSLTSEQVYENASNFDAELTRVTAEEAMADAGVKASELDIVEVHDAFAIEELFYAEAIGLAKPGEAPAMLKAGAFDIGGDVAVSPSGGLLCMGHPIGPTGAGQIAEVTRQLRGEAGPSQHAGAKVGMTHMVGIGAVCAVHILKNDN